MDHNHVYLNKQLFPPIFPNKGAKLNEKQAKKKQKKTSLLCVSPKKERKQEVALRKNKASIPKYTEDGKAMETPYLDVYMAVDESETEQASIEAERAEQDAETETEQASIEAERTEQDAETETEQASIEAERAEQDAETETEQASIEAERTEQDAETETEQTSIEAERAEQDAETETEQTSIEAERAEQDAETEDSGQNQSGNGQREAGDDGNEKRINVFGADEFYFEINGVLNLILGFGSEQERLHQVKLRIESESATVSLHSGNEVDSMDRRG